jgi:hypothetical protein
VSRTVIALALAGLLALPASAAAHPATINAKAKQTSFARLSNGIKFTETLRTGKKVIGHDAVTCIGATISTCTGTFTFKAGTVHVKGKFDQRTTINMIKIVGGVDAYKGAKGELTLKSTGRTSFDETLAFT